MGRNGGRNIMQDWDREIVKVQNNPAGRRQIPPDYFEYWAPEYRAARHLVFNFCIQRFNFSNH
jgi:hypothetical protein